eukprot:XP_011507369.1 protein CROC-4 isoform X1 [Homo sapiens]
MLGKNTNLFVVHTDRSQQPSPARRRQCVATDVQLDCQGDEFCRRKYKDFQVLAFISPQDAPPPTLSLHLPTVTVSFTRRAARERKREASEIPEWIDRCYVIGAASSTPQEARSWGERGSPAAGATRTVSPPHRSLELGIQEEAASFVFWCHRRWPPMAFGLLTWGGWVLHHPPTLLPPCGR